MDYEKIYNAIIQIIAEREHVVVTTKVERKWSQMKKHKINKAKLAINILKLECIALLAFTFDVMFIAYLIK